ncbi:MAG: hypothetical protein A2161_17090 [Candidatus Schekmanbacteria bacterium RBG_13_48_7]|uniref:Uncharacterized protein n=1 Tax=Candidatus Schekmanbacteria bacterium RBG_13_48_7 TaxID=1817878 RepID=A0A1F7S242_9BACT|nr:MAG: hypothetical protein A2161_17090 [Candidatus Schekmanbacteria bacterium RBG_13_48_7]
MNIITRIFNLIFLPFRCINPMYGLVFVSFITGIVFLIIFRYTSNQEAIKRVKNLIKAYFLEIRLYKDNLGVLLRAIIKTDLNILNYLRYFMIPMLIVIIPLILIAVQLEVRYEYRPLKSGEKTILTVQLKNAVPDIDKPVTLILPDGIVMDSKPVRVASNKTISWRLKALKQGTYNANIEVEGESVYKEIVVSNRLVPLSTSRTAANLKNYVLNPVEPFLPGSLDISSISVIYPKGELPFNIFGWSHFWVIVFFVLSMLFGFAFKGIFKVQI